MALGGASCFVAAEVWVLQAWLAMCGAGLLAGVRGIGLGLAEAGTGAGRPNGSGKPILVPPGSGRQRGLEGRVVRRPVFLAVAATKDGQE